MIFAHWMLLTATFLPIFAVVLAKLSRNFDNHQPRAYLESLDNNTMQKRMVWAQENSWEALMMFAPAVLLATFFQVDSQTMNQLTGGFVAARLAYLWCYAKNFATARSIMWFIAVACVIGLYVASAKV
jgi:uncharacterized MAPEG superfamily protein